VDQARGESEHIHAAGAVAQEHGEHFGIGEHADAVALHTLLGAFGDGGGAQAVLWGRVRLCHG